VKARVAGHNISIASNLNKRNIYKMLEQVEASNANVPIQQQKQDKVREEFNPATALTWQQAVERAWADRDRAIKSLQ
jgi:hypothetical protein